MGGDGSEMEDEEAIGKANQGGKGKGLGLKK